MDLMNFLQSFEGRSHDDTMGDTQRDERCVNAHTHVPFALCLEALLATGDCVVSPQHEGIQAHPNLQW
eukprot:12445412-Alexandrium_andersonii.AAC.1